MYKKISIFLVVITLTLTTTVFATFEQYQWTNLDETAPVSSNIGESTSNGLPSATIEKGENIEESNSLNLTAGAAILIEQTTGQILYSYNSHEQLHPASVTKVMSILLIMDQIHEGKLKLEDKIACSTNAANMGGSQIWLDPKESLSAEEMLKAICVVSANDYNVQK